MFEAGAVLDLLIAHVRGDHGAVRLVWRQSITLQSVVSENHLGQRVSREAHQVWQADLVVIQRR